MIDPRIFFGLLFALLILPFCGGDGLGVSQPTALAAEQFTPDHDDVKKMVTDGVRFLTSNRDEPSRMGIGYQLLVAYTLLKATEDHDHPYVKKTIPAALTMAKSLTPGAKKPNFHESIVYEASMLIMFFSAVDPVKYHDQIAQVCDFLFSIQRRAGGFGYLEGQYAVSQGDISQSQYAALAFWSAKQAKVDIKMEGIERLAAFMLRSQHPSGSWTYQFPPIPPTDPPRHSMLAAGLSGLLIASDILGGMRGAGAAQILEEEDDDGVPDAFQRVFPEEKARAKSADATTASRQELNGATTKAVRWLQNNRHKRASGEYYYYWLYSRERFESFIEIFSGRREASPAWYNEGVLSLKELQADDGSWGAKDLDPAGADAATSFAILFLLRTTQKAIGELKTADSVGGFGLANVADVGVVDGKVVDKSQVTSIEDAIKLLESNEDGASEDRLLADRMALSPDPQKRKEQLNRFSRLLRSPDARARRIAAKLLGRGDDLDFAPDLIFALSEGEQDQQVLRIAENSLRILSRQLDAYILPKEGPISTKDRVQAERYWQEWYLSIRPDHLFVKQ